MTLRGPTWPAESILLTSALAAAVAACGSDVTRPVGGTPHGLRIIVQPSATRGGEAITPAIGVEVLDSAGHRVTGSRTAVRLRLAAGTGKPHAHLMGVTEVAAVDGVASFGDLRVDSAGTGYRLGVTAAGLDSTVTNPFAVSVGPPAGLAFAVEPEGVTTDSSIAPAVRVRVLDRGGNFVPTATNAVTLSLGADPAGGTLAGAVTRAAVVGIATFADLRIGAAGTGYTLTAAAAGLTGAATAAFPVTVPVTQVSVGGPDPCAIGLAGATWCWSYGWTSPTLVGGGVSFTTISAGPSHICGLGASGTAWCWGANYDGRLGDGSTTNRLLPTLVAGGYTFASIAAGDGHTCAVTTSATAYCWGANYEGELGNGTNTDSHVPVVVSGQLRHSAVFAGAYHTCSLTTTGAAYCWGYGYSGQLGDGYVGSSTVPVGVSGGLSFAMLGLGDAHSCGIALGGQAWCWGDNGSAQLGVSGRASSAAPVAVATSLRFSAISANGTFTAAVATDGTAWVWGYGAAYQPVQLASPLRFRTLAAGDPTCALSVSGALYCWDLVTRYGAPPLWSGPQRVLILQ